MKILLIISNNLFYRNYLNRYVLEDLKKYAEVKILGNKVDANDSKNLFDFECGESKVNSFLHWVIASISLFSNRNLTKSFQMRVRRRFYPYIEDSITVRKILKYIKKSLILIFFILITKFKFVTSFLIFILKKFLKINKSFAHIIKTEKPDLVLIPTNGFFSFELDIECTLHKLKQKYISLIDNWDNLSSKNILMYKANHYGVWGEQNKIIAEQIQKINRNDTTCLGTPRFEVYKKLKVNKIFDFKYILFVGSSNRYNEYGVLQLLNKIIIKNKIDFKVIYRPHPWRDNSDFPDLSALNKIVLDPQMKTQYENKARSDNFQPDIDYYNDILSNCEFVIGSLTSMLIEALVKKKKYIALIHSEPGFKYSPSEWYKGYTNFDELKSLKNLILLNDLDKLEKTLFNLIEVDNTFIDDEFLSYFITFDEEPYSKKLIKMINNFKNSD